MCNIFVKSILVCISALTVFIGAVLIALPIHYGYKLNVDFETDETAVSDIPTRIINIFQYNVIYRGIRIDRHVFWKSISSLKNFVFL